MKPGNEDGRKQFTSKEAITQERTIMTFKNGRWGQRVVQEQVEFAWDQSRKAVLVNPFFSPAANRKNRK